jgi:hypothetical protein
LDLDEKFAHFSHSSRERLHPLEEKRVFEVLHDLMTIGDRVDTAQARIKERLQIVFFPASDNVIHDLIAIQVDKEVRRLGAVVCRAIFGTFKKDSMERHR